MSITILNLGEWGAELKQYVDAVLSTFAPTGLDVALDEDPEGVVTLIATSRKGTATIAFGRADRGRNARSMAHDLFRFFSEMGVNP